MFDLVEALRYMVGYEGSDLHLKVPLAAAGADPRPAGGDRGVRADAGAGHRPGAAARCSPIPSKLGEFEHDHEVDFAYAVEGLARFRVNAFRQRGMVSIALRVIPYAVRTIDELGLPPVMSEIADEERGLILLTGTTGSGKSTTLAAIIDQINETKARHIVTIEDPIEYLHSDRTSIINQREVGMDTVSFSRAMRRVLRQDPDVILIGEMRDEETVRTALSAAETGHLVLSTVHTLDAPETVNRIIDFFPLHEQSQARAMLAGTLKAVISQRLVPTPDGNGRIAVCEILRMTGRVRDMIIDPEQTGRLARGDLRGRATTACRRSTRRCCTISRPDGWPMEDALRVATSPHDFKLLVRPRANGDRDGGSMTWRLAPGIGSGDPSPFAGPARRCRSADRGRPGLAGTPRHTGAWQPRRRSDLPAPTAHSSLQFVKHCARTGRS